MADHLRDVTKKVDFISRETAIRSAFKLCRNTDYPFIDDIQNAIEEIPAADVVEVVHCKDCYAYQRDPDSAKAAGLNPAEYCALLRCEFGPGGFCSYGRRADNG